MAAMADPPTDPPQDPPADPPADPPKGDPPADPPKADDPPKDGRTFTQAEVAEMVSRERAKAKKAFEAEAAKAAERAKMDEAERLKAEKADADEAAKEARAGADRKLVVADAKIAAISAGVPADRANAFVKLADLSDVEVDDDGSVDDKALKQAVDKAIKDNPFLKAGVNGKGGASGGEFNGDTGPEQLTREQLKGMSPKEIVKAKKEGRLKAALGQT